MRTANSMSGGLCALLLASTVVGPVLANSGTPDMPLSAKQDQDLAPLVRVTTPKSFSYIIGESTGPKSRMILMGIEITDRSGAGIVSNDAGIPKFVNSNDNVDRFARCIVAKGSYTDNLGHTVLQLFAEIPLSQLKIDEDLYVSPPLSVQHMRREDHKDGIVIPENEAVRAAVFSFEVRDLQGHSSKVGEESDEGSEAYVGFTDRLYKPPIPGPTQDKTTEESETQPN